MDRRLFRSSAAVAGLALMTLGLMATPLVAQQQDSTGDAVADAARKAREQKKKEGSKPKKVYTDEDVNHVIPSTAAASGDATPGPDAAKNGDAQGKDANGKTAETKENPEVMWRKQFRDAYANLDRAQKELDILQREDSKAQVQYYSDPQKALAEQYTRQDIVDKDAKIAAKKKEVDQLKQKISDMEDALRKSGGDPGWAAP
jgi:hypothetical protein